MKQTPLYSEHLRLNARMVDFSGWQMPIQYQGLIEEHKAVRENAGAFDVSHMLVVDIKGQDAQKYIRYLLANDVAKIAHGKAMYSCMLNQNGGVVDDLIVYYFSDDYIRVVVNAGNRESDVEWMLAQSQGFSVSITPRPEYAIIAIQGPNARDIVNNVLAEKCNEQVKALKPFSMTIVNDWMIARTGYTGEDGYEIALPQAQAVDFWQALLAAGVEPIGLGARDTLRLEAGLNLYGQDMTTETSPLVAGLAWTVCYADADRDFIGKKALLAQSEHPHAEMIGLVLDGRGILRSGMSVVDANGEQVGVITSGTFSPTLSESIAMARLERPCTDLFIQIRKNIVPAHRVKYPFVRKGKKVYQTTI